MKRFHQLSLLSLCRHMEGDALMNLYEPRHEISNNVVYATTKDSNQPAHRPTRRLIGAFASRLDIL